MFVASGKKNKYHCNTWVIKSTVQDKVLEFGNQRACELTDLSTRDVAKVLIASGVNTSIGTVTTSMKSKIEEKRVHLTLNYFLELERRRNNQEFL